MTKQLEHQNFQYKMDNTVLPLYSTIAINALLSSTHVGILTYTLEQHNNTVTTTPQNLK